MTNMLPDSTQTDPPLKKKRKAKQEKESHKNPKKKGKSSSLNAKTEPDPDLDPAVTLYAMSEYVMDREELMSQIVRSLKEVKVKSMLPPILKGMPFEELKNRCIEQLKVMSRHRIMALLQDIDPDDITSSGTEEEEDAAANVSETCSPEAAQVSRTRVDNSKMFDRTVPGDVNLMQSQGGVDDPGNFPSGSQPDGSLEMNTTGQKGSVDSPGKSNKGPIESPGESKKGHIESPGESKKDEPVERSKAEILELEMRAKAIRSLLRANLNKDKV